MPLPAGPLLGLPEGRPHGVGPTKPSREAVNFIRACIQAAKPGKLLNICSPPQMDPLLHGGAPPSTVCGLVGRFAGALLAATRSAVCSCTFPSIYRPY